VTLQFGASLTDDTRSINYDRNTFIIQAKAAVWPDLPNFWKSSQNMPKYLSQSRSWVIGNFV